VLKSTCRIRELRRPPYLLGVDNQRKPNEAEETASGSGAGRTAPSPAPAFSLIAIPSFIPSSDVFSFPPSSSRHPPCPWPAASCAGNGRSPWRSPSPRGSPLAPSGGSCCENVTGRRSQEKSQQFGYGAWCLNYNCTTTRSLMQDV